MVALQLKVVWALVCTSAILLTCKNMHNYAWMANAQAINGYTMFSFICCHDMHGDNNGQLHKPRDVVVYTLQYIIMVYVYNNYYT